MEGVVKKSMSSSWTRPNYIRTKMIGVIAIIISQAPLLFIFLDRGYPFYGHLIFSVGALPFVIMLLRNVYVVNCDDEFIYTDKNKKIKISEIDFFSICGSPEWGLNLFDFRHGAYVKMKSKIPFLFSYEMSCSKETALALRLLKLGVPHKLNPSTPAWHYDDTAESRRELERIKSQEL